MMTSPSASCVTRKDSWICSTASRRRRRQPRASTVVGSPRSSAGGASTSPRATPPDRACRPRRSGHDRRAIPQSRHRPVWTARSRKSFGAVDGTLRRRQGMSRTRSRTPTPSRPRAARDRGAAELAESHLGLRRMHVDVDPGRIEIEVDDADRMPGRIEQAAEPLLQRVGQRTIRDGPTVQDESLLLRGRTGGLRDVPTRPQTEARVPSAGSPISPWISMQLSLEFASDHLDDPSSGIVGGGEVEEHASARWRRA